MSRDPTLLFYNQFADVYESFTKGLQPHEWILLFMNTVTKKGDILDLGCAYGRDCKTFIENGFSMTGIDFSDALIKKAKKNSPQARFLIKDMRDLNASDGVFDGVWACASLLHIPKKDMSGVLGSIYTSLTSGGVLFLNMKSVMEKASYRICVIEESISSTHFTRRMR